MNDLYLHTCGALWEKYCHLDGNHLVVPPFTLGSRKPSPGLAAYCDEDPLDTNTIPIPIFKSIFYATS